MGQWADICAGTEDWLRAGDLFVEDRNKPVDGRFLGTQHFCLVCIYVPYIIRWRPWNFWVGKKTLLEKNESTLVYEGGLAGEETRNSEIIYRLLPELTHGNPGLRK